jgi:hypothetical protein
LESPGAFAVEMDFDAFLVIGLRELGHIELF